MSALREEVALTSRRLAAAGLLIGTAGNVSVRDGDLVHVTGSGVELGACTSDDVTTVDLDGVVVAGRLRPTSEIDLHLGIHRSETAEAVVHTHGRWSTAIACLPDRFPVMPVLHYQQMLLGGEIRVAPYATFGTPQLAELVISALRDRSGALMANHGSITTGSSLAKAADNALLLEWLAELLHRTSQLTPDPVGLDEAQQVDVIHQALALDYGHATTNPGSTS